MTYTLEQIIEILSRTLAEMEQQAVSEAEFADLSMRQVYYLDTILEMGQPTFSDLAQQLNLSKPSVTALVHKLIQKGYVHKIQSDEDRRTYHILPAPKAQEFTRMHQAFHQHLVEIFTQRLNKTELQQLADLLNKVLQNPEN